MKIPRFLTAPTGRRIFAEFSRSTVDLLVAWSAGAPADKAEQFAKLHLPGWAPRLEIEYRPDGFLLRLSVIAPGGTTEFVDEIAVRSIAPDMPTAGRA